MTARPPVGFFHPAHLVATGFGVGRIPWAPGTWGSAAALAPGVALHWWLGPLWLAVAALLVLAAGAFATERLLARGATHDPPYVVVDEIGGQWLALVPAVPDPLSVGLAFVFFRLFDVAKPGPIGWVDRNLVGSIGAMLDDGLAGVAAALALAAVLWWLP
ncbi:phosphatidylglycerophosphatase A [Stella sp.]|uniref:phosphatidylglycerophosphatase A family protein n=1 Tax=Stella sp. TaxID=2912054 RepID=UPI0035B452F0